MNESNVFVEAPELLIENVLADSHLDRSSSDPVIPETEKQVRIHGFLEAENWKNYILSGKLFTLTGEILVPKVTGRVFGFKDDLSHVITDSKSTNQNQHMQKLLSNASMKEYLSHTR